MIGREENGFKSGFGISNKLEFSSKYKFKLHKYNAALCFPNKDGGPRFFINGELDNYNLYPDLKNESTYCIAYDGETATVKFYENESLIRKIILGDEYVNQDMFFSASLLDESKVMLEGEATKVY